MRIEFPKDPFPDDIRPVCRKVDIPFFLYIFQYAGDIGIRKSIVVVCCHSRHRIEACCEKKSIIAGKLLVYENFYVIILHLSG